VSEDDRNTAWSTLAEIVERHPVDPDLLEKARAEIEAEIAGHRRAGGVFLAKVAEHLKGLDPASLSPSDIARWTEVALKLENAGNVRRAPENRREAVLDAQLADTAECECEHARCLDADNICMSCGLPCTDS
jgi:hypothetical protein